MTRWRFAVQVGEPKGKVSVTIQAIVFDLGGVLENEIETDMHAKWEARLGLKPGELRERYFSTGWLIDATYGKFTEEEMLQKLGEIFGMDRAQVDAFMLDFWDLPR
jgi:hypothetical protein